MTKAEIKKLKDYEAKAWDQVKFWEEQISKCEERQDAKSLEPSKRLYKGFLKEWVKIKDVMKLLGVKSYTEERYDELHKGE